MKYEDDSAEFPNYSMRNQDIKLYNYDEDENQNKKIWIIVIIIIIILVIVGLIIFLVLYFKNKNKKEEGGYINAKYIIPTSNEITIFNPSYVNLKSNDYSIEVIEIETANTNNTRILDNDITINENKFSSNKKGLITFKIRFKKALESMSQMFEECENLVEIDLSNFVSDKVRYLSSTFCHCESLESINFSNFKSSNLVTMYAAFENCLKLTALNLSSFTDTSNLKSMNSMLRNCNNIVYLNLNYFKFINDVNIREILFHTNNLKVVIIEDSTVRNKIDKYHNYLNDINNVICEIGENEKCKECNDNFGEFYKCKSCNEGYFLPEIDYPTICRKCFIENCANCSKYLSCENCKIGFYLSSYKDECLSCADNCLQCNDINNCTNCKDNYILNNGNCIFIENEIDSSTLSTDIIDSTDESSDFSQNSDEYISDTNDF